MSGPPSRVWPEVGRAVASRWAAADSHGVPERNEVLPGAVPAPCIVLEGGVLPGVV